MAAQKGKLDVFEFQDGMVIKDGEMVNLTSLGGAPVRMIAQADSIPKFIHTWRVCPDCKRKLRSTDVVIVTDPKFWWPCYHCEKWVRYKNGKDPRIYDLGKAHEECE